MSLENIISKTKKSLKGLACVGIVGLALAGGVKEAKADIITWQYKDDFSTIKAESDSYEHSTFWPEMALPPPDPYLYYSRTTPPAEMLVFNHGVSEDAFLAYSFPLDNILTQVDSGTFGLDVLLPEDSSYLLYKLSEDGVNWINASQLVKGHNTLSLLPSDNSNTYIKLYANYAKIDNLSVTVRGPEIPEPSTLALLGIGLTGLLYLKHKQKKSES